MACKTKKTENNTFFYEISMASGRSYPTPPQCTTTCNPLIADDCNEQCDLNQDCVTECEPTIPFPGIQEPSGCSWDPCIVPNKPPDVIIPPPPICTCNPCPSNPYAPCPPDLCDPANCRCGEKPPDPCSCPPSPYDPCPPNPCPGCICDQCPPDPCPPDPCIASTSNSCNNKSFDSTKMNKDIIALENFLKKLNRNKK